MSDVVSVGESSTGAGRLKSQRFVSAAGVLFAALLLAGLAVQSLAVGGAEDESRQEVVARYADGANELLAHAGALLVGFAVVCGLPFLAGLRAAARRAEDAPAVLSNAAFAGGVVLTVFAAAASAVTVGAFSSSDFYEAYEVDPNVVLLMQTLSFSALGFALVGGAVLVGATSLLALRTRLLPRRLAVASLPLTAVLAFGEWAMFVVIPLPLLLVWVLVVALLLARRRRASQLGLETALASSHNS